MVRVACCSAAAAGVLTATIRSNRVFKSYDDLVDHCCEAWNKLTDQPWRIMSIGLRQWAHGF
jgi:hypothetical protein